MERREAVGKPAKYGFSIAEHTLSSFERDAEARAFLAPAEPFSKAQRTEAATRKRVRNAIADYFYFDKTYFPEDMYTGGYAESGKFHRALHRHATAPGTSVVIGPRLHGKTPTMKKITAWLMLTGRRKFCSILSSTLPNARNIMRDIARLIEENPRIAHDFAPEFKTLSGDDVIFSVPGIARAAVMRPYSEGRSVRGASDLFDRPDFLYADDVETRESPLSDEQTNNRLRLLAEAVKSLASGATAVIVGNNFDEGCALNKLKIEYEAGVLPENWSVMTYKAWDDDEGSLWPERYPAASEAELRLLLNPYDESEWSGDFQGDPIPPDGIIFQRPQKEWSELPDDLRGVIWCDPNLSKKGKGDTTAVTALGYSAKTMMKYVVAYICRSYSNSNALLNDVFKMRSGLTGRFSIIGFDGNVSQESTWSNNVRLWAQITKAPPYKIHYRRYHVDDLTKNTQSDWNAGKILLPPYIMQSKEGQRYVNQIFAFRGKKANNKNDAPDSLICADELLSEMKFIRRARTAQAVVPVITRGRF